MINKIIKKFLMFRQTYFKKINKNFYSQFGEDKILYEIISRKQKKGFYVDVGCFHPKKYSNTYMLYKRGWRGVNIDMEKDKIETFNIARPNDFNFLGAVSNKVEKVKIFRNQKFGVSSTLNENMINKNNIIDESFIETCTLDYILNLSPFKNKEIDLLNIDTEGNDLKVLKSLNFNIYKPKIIIIETHLKNIDKILASDPYNFLINKNYKLSSWNIYSLIFEKIIIS